MQRLASDGSVEDEFQVATISGGYFDIDIQGQFSSTGEMQIWAHWSGDKVSINTNPVKKKITGERGLQTTLKPEN